MGRLITACTLFLGICLAALPAGAAQRVALVIGNSDYELISSLANPKNDAALMAETLREVGFEVIEAKNADRRGMARAIRDFGKRLRGAGSDAVGLFYYAGHGVQARGANYLIPLGAQVETEADLEIEAVSASWVLGQMEYAGNALNIVILDACRNNPFKGSFRAVTRGLARMDAPSGSLVAYAAGPGQVAADGRGRNSPYTSALAQAMREPGLDLEDVFKRVRVAVEAATGEKQTPWEESSLKGDFYFAPQGPTVTVTPPGAPPAFDARALDLAFWNSIKDSNNPADFEAYLTQYPQGTFAGLATVRRDGLKDRPEETAVAALPPAATPGYEIEEIDETYYVLKPANVRSGPGTSFEKVGRLSLDNEVGVTGKVLGKPWLRIALEGGEEAYVYGPLLSAEKPKPPKPAVVEEKPQPAKDQVAVGVYPEAGRQPGDTFKDCADCPEMVVIPPGRFRMGDLSGDAYDILKPVHAVTIGYKLAVGTYEVTRGEFAAFVNDTGYGASGGCWYYTGSDWEESASTSWRSPGFGQSDRDPVVCVSWDDAKAYLRWISRKTEVTYRLLSEAEWEYMARAGSTSKYPFGNSENNLCDHGNGADRSSGFYWRNTICSDGYGERTAPAGSYRPNAFGVFDTLGNVWEWTEDCWHDSYHGAPSDGRAWTTGGDCGKRAKRGGGWTDESEVLRPAVRSGWSSTDYRNWSYGFRVARTL